MLCSAPGIHNIWSANLKFIMMIRLSFSLTLLLSGIFFFACNNQNNPSQASTGINYQPTKLPIQLEKLSEEQRSHIRKAHETDTSSYMMNTRPILFQIQGIGDNRNETRGTAMLYYQVEVMIYAFAEVIDGQLVDYGWIQNMLSGEIVWEMDSQKAEFGGGAARNVKFVDHITLQPGRYELRYISNASHSNDGWEGAPPERPFYYGITVFNLKAIEGFKPILEKK